MRRYLFILLAVGVLCAPAFAQETGSVSGTITMDDGTGLPGVTVTAVGDVLPQPRIVVSSGTGEYRFPLLPPGNYELTFEMDGMATQKYALEVLLERNSVVNVTMTSASVADVIEVRGGDGEPRPHDADDPVGHRGPTIDALPVGQEYRDFLKLAPGVQYTEDTIRGPSAGGNGQDNVYKLDGVDVGLPLFGRCPPSPPPTTSSRSPSSGVASRPWISTARVALTMNSVTRSGTNPGAAWSTTNSRVPA